MNCDLLFPTFVSSLFFIKHFQAKVNITYFVLALASGTKPCTVETA